MLVNELQLFPQEVLAVLQHKPDFPLGVSKCKVKAV